MILRPNLRHWYRAIFILVLSVVFTSCKSKPSGAFTSQIKLLVASDTLHPKHFKAAVAAEALPDSIFYNKYIPILYQLKVPEWNADSLRLNTTLHCVNDSMTPNYYCPVAYHFERLLAPLAENMRFSRNIYSPTAGWPYFGDINCDIIEPHFNHISVGINDIHTYIDKLKKECSLAKDLTATLRNLTNMSPVHVSQANNRFTSLMDTTKDFFNDEFKMVHMAGFVGLQTTYILTKYMETLRWSNAFASCQTYRLNIGLVNSYILQSSLVSVQKSAEERGYKLSIPSHEYLPHYYKLPLTDCILSVQSSRKTNLMIRVLVPVMKKEAKYTRMRLTKIPYLVTQLGQKKICEVDGFDPTDEFLIEENPEGSKPVVTYAPECFENELCSLSEQPRKFVVDPCLKGLMAGHLDTIRDYCSFDCFDIDNEDISLPIIMKVATNQYSITGGPSKESDKISIYCDDIHSQDLSPNKTNGVLQVILPCHCDLRYKAMIYRSYQPCDDPVEIHYLASIPFRLTLLSGEAAEHLKYHHHHNGSQNGTEEEELATAEGWEAEEEVLAESKVKEHEHCESHSGQFAMIWIIVTLLIVSNGIMIYIAYCNRLIHFDMVTGLFSRFGLGSAPTPRRRLDEDITIQHQPNDNNGTWPATLNRL